MKILSLLIFCFIAGGAFALEDEDFECNLKTCVIDLLDFNDFDFGALIRKIQAAVFCVKQCSPPIVHEFLESISFAFTKKISGKCRHMECAEHNRFIALSHCAKKEAWPLLQCSKRLFDLLQIPLEEVDPVNTTCTIVIETTQCLEETFQRCGERIHGLIREIVRKPLTLGLNIYCRTSHREYVENLLTPPPPAE